MAWRRYIYSYVTVTWALKCFFPSVYVRVFILFGFPLINVRLEQNSIFLSGVQQLEIYPTVLWI